MIKDIGFLVAIFFAGGSQLSAQTLDHTPVRQNMPVPDGWVIAPKLVLDNSKNPPVVFVGAGKLTTLTFPKEVSWCSQKNKIFTHRIKGQPDRPDGDDSEGRPFTEMDVLTKKGGFEQLEQEMASVGRSVFDHEVANMNCRFTSGEVAIIMLKLSQWPYLSVELLMPSQKRDVAFLRQTRADEPRKLPIENPLFKRQITDPIIAEEKKDWSLIRSAFRKGDTP